LFGYPSFVPETIGFWDEQVHPADRARISGSIAEALSSDAENWTGEYRFRHREGSYLQVLERAFILRGDDRKAVRFVGSLMDVTARRHLHDQLSRSQKMEAFGQLASGVAHDFNNFLTSILGYGDLVLAEAGDDVAIARHVSEIRKAAGRASALTSQLLAFSRRQVLEPQVVEVNALIQNLERTLLPLLGENITVVCDLHHDAIGGHMKVDPGQLTQIITNLAVNAREAMPKGGELRLETAITKLTGGDEALVPGDYVAIRVIDTGVGMSEEANSHLFEPFFTTKTDTGNSGLGLAISYGIVAQSGGAIRVESERGKGTKVQIFLPRVPAPPPPSYRKPSNKVLPTGTETIMVVEDDVSVRHVSVRVLRSLGYDVVEAASTTDAQRLFQERDGQPVHLVLTDVVMPHMSGRDFADWVCRASPKTKIVFVSGYLEDSVRPRDGVDSGTFFLSKPFDPEQLATAIRQALDS
jgi:signal transduction histidine kinase/ActR/RegA family two-component response regulator